MTADLGISSNLLDSLITHDTVRDMQVAAPALMPVFRSPLQALLLARVLPEPSDEFSVADLARALEADLATVSRETTRLVHAGVLSERRAGRTRLLRANTDSPVYQELLGLSQKTYGLAHLAFDTFKGLRGLTHVVIFGSWAARFHGERGHAPQDLDVLLVGNVSKLKATLRADQLSQRIGMPVGLSYAALAEWTADSINLVREIKRTPHVAFVAGAQQ